MTPSSAKVAQHFPVASGIVQRGTHEELLAEEGIYRRFWNASNRAGAWKIAP